MFEHIKHTHTHAHTHTHTHTHTHVFILQIVSRSQTPKVNYLHRINIYNILFTKKEVLKSNIYKKSKNINKYEYKPY